MIYRRAPRARFPIRLPIPARSSVLLTILIAALVSTSSFAGAIAATDPPFHCYLTWQGDPTTTLTVNFQTVDTHVPAEFLFDTVSHDGTPGSYPFRAVASEHVIPGLNAIAGAQRFIHVAELTDLTPGGSYYFVAGSPDGGYTPQRSVRLPDRSLDTLRFIDGGDMSTNAFVPPLLQAAAAQSPQFAILGGDLAYENGVLTSFALWDAWLTNWETYMVTPAGHTVPMIVAIGNHEVNGGFGSFDDPPTRAPFYFGYFAQSGHGFDTPRSAVFRRDFGPRASLLVLDSGHVTPLTGAQADFIADQLAQLGRVDLRMAAYHVPMFPSERRFDLAEVRDVRNAWLPLFDAGALDVSFEHHDHMLKRTKLLRNSAPDPAGTLYLGDGCLGQTPRTGVQAIALEDPAELARLGLSESYLASWSPARNFWLIEITRGATSSTRRLHATALDANSAVLDETFLVIESRSGETNVTHPQCVASLLLGGPLSALRAFRDRRLLPNAPGAALADAYYRISPATAAWLTAHPNLLTLMQAAAQNGAGASSVNAALLAALTLGVASAGIVQRRRRNTASAA